MGRTRKTIVAISAGLVSVLIMAGVAAASRGSSDQPGAQQLRVEDSSTSSLSTGTPSSDVSPSSGVSTTDGTGVTTSSEPGDDNGVEPSTTFDDNGNDTSTTFDDDTSTTFPDDTSSSVPDDNTSTTLPPVDAGERTFTVAGGTVVVDVHEDHSLTLVSVTPNRGVEVNDQREEGDEVRVEFRGPDGDSRVRVRFDEGRLRIETGDN
jgi:hypothetical protein